MRLARILIAGVGNIFFGDDGFGCEVARVLSERTLPAGVSVKDFGIRGVDLAYEISTGWDAVIFVDVTERGALPGTLFTIEPEAVYLEGASSVSINAHTLSLTQVLPAAQQLGPLPKVLRLIACEPATLEGDDAGVGLSPPVHQAVISAANMVETLAQQLSGQAHA